MRARLTILCHCLAVLLLSGCSGKPSETKEVLLLTKFPLNEQTVIPIREAFLKAFPDSSKVHFTVRNAASGAYERLEDRLYYHPQFSMFTEVFEKLNFKPDLIITVGDLISQTAYDFDHPYLEDTPVLCLSTMYPEWRDSRLMRRKNFTGLYSLPAAKENIDFIRDLGGNSWIITGIDSTFLDEKLRSSIMEQMGSDTAHYITNLQFETYDRLMDLSGRDLVKSTIIPINQMHTNGTEADTLYNANFHIPGIFMVKNNHATFLRLKDDQFLGKSFGYNLGNYFANYPRYFNLPLLSALNGNIGGYFCSWESMADQAKPVIKRLLNGESPSSIPWTVLSQDYWLDWRLAKSMHKYASDFPSYVNFVNLPWSSKSHFNDFLSKHWLMFIIFLVALTAVFMPLSLFLRSLRVHKELIQTGEFADRKRVQMESILEANKSFAWELLAGDVVHFNENFARFAHLDRCHFPVEDVLSYVSEGREKLEDALFGSTVLTVVDVLVVLSNGQSQPFAVYVNHIDDELGSRMCNGFAVSTDDAYEAERIRKEAAAIAEETSTKESFLASMSHEIRSPLNSIVGFADLLAKQNKSLSGEERIDLAAHIQDSMEQMLSLLENVMSYTNTSDIKIELEKSKLDIAKLMEDMYFSYKYIMPEDLSLKLVRGPEGQAIANRSAVRQILSNLMNNAIKFTHEGGITIGWDIETKGPTREVLFWIQDTGVGVAPENQERIFEKFYKTDNHTVGAGIGLSLCVQLAEAMDGKIELQSTLGKGSKFILRVGGV